MDLKPCSSVPADVGKDGDDTWLSKPSSTHLQAETCSVPRTRRGSLSNGPEPLAALGRISTSLVNIFHGSQQAQNSTTPGNSSSESSPSLANNKPRNSPSFMSNLLSSLTSPLTPPRRKSTSAELAQHYSPIAQPPVSTVPPHRLLLLVQACFRHIEENGRSVQGIFRIGGTKSVVSELVADCRDTSKPVDDVIARIYKLDCGNIASAVKQLYRECVKKLAVHETRSLAALYEDWSESKAQQIKTQLDECPPINRALWGLLVHHLHRFEANQPTTLMSANALAIVLAPNVTAEPDFTSSAEQITYSETQRKATELLIKKAEYFFPWDKLKQLAEELTTILAPKSMTLACHAKQLLNSVGSLDGALRTQAGKDFHAEVVVVTYNSKMVCRRILELDVAAEDGRLLQQLSQDLLKAVTELCNVASAPSDPTSEISDKLMEQAVVVARVAKDIEQIGRNIDRLDIPQVS